MAAIDNRAGLVAVLICPNRALAQEFSNSVPASKAFKIAANVSTYPAGAELEDQLKQLRPDVVLLDLSADTEQALQLVSSIAAIKPSIFVVGLHEQNDAGVIIRSLRAGATEFLCSPFDQESQSTVLARILRLRESQEVGAPKRGKVLAFAGAKAGQGATTLAYHTAFWLAEEAKARVLLVDFDILGGTVSFVLRVSHSYSVVDAVHHAERLDHALWNALVNTSNGFDVLLAPEKPEVVNADGHRVPQVMEYTRSVYDWIVVDLPAAYERISQACIGDADQVFLVSNPELQSLHLTRKAILFIERELGVDRSQLGVVVNRMSRRLDLTADDMEKVFNYPITKVFAEDASATQNALTSGKPMPASGELGRALRDFGRSLTRAGKGGKKKGVGPLKLGALLSNGLYI